MKTRTWEEVGTQLATLSPERYEVVLRRVERLVESLAQLAAVDAEIAEVGRLSSRSTLQT